MAETTTLYLRRVPRALVQEAKSIAARRGSTLTSFVTEALASAVDSGAGDETGPEKDFRESIEWFDRHRGQRRQSDPGDS